MAAEGLLQMRVSFFSFLFGIPRCPSVLNPSEAGGLCRSTLSFLLCPGATPRTWLVAGHSIFQGVVGIFSWVTASRPHDLVPIMVYLLPLLSCLSLVDIVSLATTHLWFPWVLVTLFISQSEKLKRLCLLKKISSRLWSGKNPC